MFLRFGVIENAQLIERLSLSDEGDILLRRTTDMEVEDTIPVVKVSELPSSSYFDKLRSAGKDVKLLQDGTQWTLVQFFPSVMSGKGITSSDLQFITGNTAASTDSAYLYGNRLIQQDLICKNGYLHEMEDVLLPPNNMAGYIRTNDNLSSFNRLLDRFATPRLYKISESGDSIWELRYFNKGSRSLSTDNDGKTVSSLLSFDPGWNLYASTSATGKQAAYEQTMGCMFVPTNEAMDKFFSPTGEGADFYNAFGTWDNVPTTMVADIINAYMKNSFLTALPSNFENVVDEYGYSMNISQSDIDNCYIARNGLIYVTNKVFAPQDYKTVMGPAKINLDNSIFAEAISNTDYTYYAYLLRAPKNIYYFFVTPDEYCKDYVDPVSQGYSNATLRCKLNFYINSNNRIVATPISLQSGDTIRNVSNFPLSSGTSVTSHIDNRMEDIMGQHTIVCSYDGELEDRIADGQEYFVSNSYAPVHIKSLSTGGRLGGSGNQDQLKVMESFKKDNGRTFIVDGLLQSTTQSIYDILSSKSQFSEFFNICEAIGAFSTASVDKNAALDYIVSFLSRYHYTIYVPTNDAIRAAQAAGKLPTISQWESEGDAEVKAELEKKLLRFVKYHFQDNSIFIKGEKESGASYLSCTLNEQTGKFFPISVTNTGSSITLTDNADSANSYLRQREYYALVNNCNYYIAHLDTAVTKLVDGVSSKYVRPYMAQAKAIRAWTYLQICLDYSEAIYTTTPVLDNENTTDQRHLKLDELLPLLISDVNSALDYLPSAAISTDNWVSGYTDPGFTSSVSYDSYAAKQLMLPLHFVLGELYMWQGDFQSAVEQYYYLILNNHLTTGSTYRNQYDQTGEKVSSSRWANQFSGFAYSDILTAIVFGTTSDLVGSELYTMANKDYTIAPSSALVDEFNSQLYYTGSRTISGDLRGLHGTYKETTTSTATSETTDLYITKYGNMRTNSVPYVALCRSSLIYLRYAECCNRLGRPRFVFNGFLKYGLSAENIGSTYAATFAGEDLTPAWMDFGQNDLEATTGTATYFSSNTTGFHARGCGRTELNEAYAIEPQATLQDSILWVEDQLITEYALETALEGNRFHDLMRIARYRNDPTYLATKVASKFSADKRARILSLLSDESNWYLPKE